jgi:hypothetical protein
MKPEMKVIIPKNIIKYIDQMEQIYNDLLNELYQELLNDLS